MAGPDPRQNIQDQNSEVFSMNKNADDINLSVAEMSGWNAKDSNWLIMAGCAVVGAYPKIPDWFCELTPVNWAANSVVKLMCSGSEINDKVYHLANPTPVSYESMFDVLKGNGIEMKAVLYDEWRQLCKDKKQHMTTGEKSSRLESMWALVESLENEDQMKGADCTTFDCTQLLQSLCNISSSKEKVDYPPVDAALMTAYTKHWKETNVFN